MKGEYDFAEVVNGVRQNVENNFVTNSQGIITSPTFLFHLQIIIHKRLLIMIMYIFFKAILLPDTDWTYDEEYSQLKESIDEIATKLRAEETKKMIKALEVREMK